MPRAPENFPKPQGSLFHSSRFLYEVATPFRYAKQKMTLEQLVQQRIGQKTIHLIVELFGFL